MFGIKYLEDETGFIFYTAIPASGDDKKVIRAEIERIMKKYFSAKTKRLGGKSDKSKKNN